MAYAIVNCGAETPETIDRFGAEQVYTGPRGQRQRDRFVLRSARAH